MELFPLWIYLKYYGPEWIPRLDRQLWTTCTRPVLTRPFRKQFGSYTTRYATGRQNVAWFIPSCSLVLSSPRGWRLPVSAHLQGLRYTGQLWVVGGEELCDELVNSRTARTSWRGVVRCDTQHGGRSGSGDLGPSLDHPLLSVPSLVPPDPVLVGGAELALS